MIAFPLFIFVEALQLASAHPTIAQGCLRYEPDTVAIVGRLSERTFFGAPGFGETPKRDAKEVGFYPDLPRAICTMPGRDADLNPPKHDVQRIQLVLDSDGYARLRSSLGKTVSVRGTLFASITGHHHAPLLLTVLKQASAR